MQKLKKKLLNTGYFIDNNYLDEYIKLISGLSIASYTERHHILPKAYYKLKRLKIDNSADNLVSLSFAEHCKAHWLLYYCTKDKLQYASQTAFVIMVNGLTKHIKDYTESDFIALQELKNQLLEDSTTYWSRSEDTFLKQNFLKFTDEELADKLNRTVGAVCARRTYLHLQRFKMADFTEEEVSYIIASYHQKEIKQIAADLERPVQAIFVKCHRLGLRKKANSWSEDEIDFLRANATTMSLTDLSNALGRSKLAIKRQCHVKQIKCKRTDLWSDAEVAYLQENYTAKTAKQMAAYLGRSIGAVEGKCQQLNLTKNKKNKS